jgi:hypothetical protein
MGGTSSRDGVDETRIQNFDQETLREDITWKSYEEMEFDTRTDLSETGCEVVCSGLKWLRIGYNGRLLLKMVINFRVA